MATSPNEPFFFPLWHAGLDRLFLRWQQRLLQHEGGSAVQSFWGYPSRHTYPELNTGCALDDVVSECASCAVGRRESRDHRVPVTAHPDLSEPCPVTQVNANFAFHRLGGRNASGAAGFTHRELLQLQSPGLNLLYDYDDYNDESSPRSA